MALSWPPGTHTTKKVRVKACGMREVIAEARDRGWFPLACRRAGLPSDSGVGTGGGKQFEQRRDTSTGA